MITEFGNGPPLVLIPGIQGRWEYLRPAIDQLARTFRVLTFPLSGEPHSGLSFDPSLALDNYTRQVRAALDRSGLDRAIVCGVSFGGLPAIRFAATCPERTRALVLVSTPGPGWHLRRRHRVYTLAPWLFGPLFVVESPFRLRPEILRALPDRRDRWAFVRGQLNALGRAPLSLSRMAARANLIATADVRPDCAAIAAPALIVTGERALDRVVDVDRTRVYLDLIKASRHVTIERTGHLGSITRPDVFASLIRDFVADAGSGFSRSYPRDDRATA